MLTTLSATLATIFSAVLLGLPIGLWISRSIFAEILKRSLITFAISLIAGFALSAVAASWSYGVTNIDNYLPILLALSVLLWVVTIVTSLRCEVIPFIKGWEVKDLFVLAPIVVATYLSRGNWKGTNEAVLVAGSGPDTAQNLMAAQSARTLGINWRDQSQKFLDYVDQPNLREGVMHLFRLPSFRDQAGVDYLVYGTRWGLTVPYSQVLKRFGNSAILWETGYVLLTSLVALSIIVYASTKVLARFDYTPVLATLAVVANTPFLVQYFNGGLSQGWALVGNAGVFLAMIISLRGLYGNRNVNQKGLVALIVISWLAVAVTYIDSAIVIGLLLLLMTSVFSLKDKAKGFKFLTTFATGGVIAAALVPAFTFASAITFDLRLKAASGTGIPSQIWPLPSELLGFVNIFTSGTEKRSPETLLIALAFSAYFLFKFTPGLRKKNDESWISIAGYGVFVVFFVGLVLSLTGPLGSNYIYLKVATYVAPLALILIFVILEQSKFKRNKSKIKTNILVPIVLSTTAIVSASTAQASSIAQATTIPYGFKAMLDDDALQDELQNYNYLVPYVLSSNLFGVFGNVHWITKAPNDIIIGDRINSELRLICLASDPGCTPNTPPIESRLNSYSIKVFASPFSTAEIFQFTPRQRFDENFKAFGQPAQEIPERFVGGNPYFND